MSVRLTKPEMINEILGVYRHSGNEHGVGEIFFRLAFLDETALIKICRDLRIRIE